MTFGITLMMSLVILSFLIAGILSVEIATSAILFCVSGYRTAFVNHLWTWRNTIIL